MMSIKALLFAATAVAATEDTDGYQQGAACYGYGGGHGVWKCGTSEAWCTEIGGVARYAEGYVSSRSGACMCETGCPSADSVVAGFTKGDSFDGHACKTGSTTQCGVNPEECTTGESSGEIGTAYLPGALNSDGCCHCDENCDHDAETGTDCATGYPTAVASPSPPPLPPSPPPSPSFPPAAGDSPASVVTMQLMVSGTVEDNFPDRKKATIASTIAILVAVHPDDITVSFAAGSVLITIEIACPDAAAVTKVTAALEAAMPDAETATASLGGKYGSILYGQSVEEVVSISVSGSPTGLIIGIVAAVVVLLVVVIVYFKKCKKKKAPAGKEPPAQGAAV